MLVWSCVGTWHVLEGFCIALKYWGFVAIEELPLVAVNKEMLTSRTSVLVRWLFPMNTYLFHPVDFCPNNLKWPRHPEQRFVKISFSWQPVRICVSHSVHRQTHLRCVANTALLGEEQWGLVMHFSRLSKPELLLIVPCGPSSVWPRWGGLMLHPAACCSAAPPMRGQEPLSPGPMRAAGSGLGLRVGLFNLWGEQQSAPSVPDGYVVVMVMFPSFYFPPLPCPPISSATNVATNTIKGASLPQQRGRFSCEKSRQGVCYWKSTLC